MDIYDLIIIILILVIIYLYMMKDKKEHFISSVNNDTPIYGNIIDFVAGDKDSNYEKIFKQKYKITGFKITTDVTDGKYKIKVNNIFLSIGNTIDFESGKLYECFDDNIITKSFEITSGNNNIVGIEIYGLDTINSFSKEQYDINNPIDYFDINSNTSTATNIITISNNNHYLTNYIEFDSSLTAATDNIEIYFKNEFTSDYEKIMGIKEYNNNYEKNSKKIYFNDYVLFTHLKIVNINLANDKNNITIQGRKASEEDKDIYKVKKNINDSSSIVLNEEKCPPINQIIDKQKIINDLCNSITEKDEIRDKQIYYEKLKKYINKLKSQEQEISFLQNKLETLISSNERVISPQEIRNIQNLINELSLTDIMNINDLTSNNTN